MNHKKELLRGLWVTPEVHVACGFSLPTYPRMRQSMSSYSHGHCETLNPKNLKTLILNPKSPKNPNNT